MEIEVYCDESYPDLFSSLKPKAQYLIIGGLWLRRADRANYKTEIHNLRNIHKIGGEFKWAKVSPSKIDFYKDLITWFCDKGGNSRFRCIAVDHKQVDLVQFHENDQELGFYKFYYQMLKHWIHDFNSYSIFCDCKSIRKADRLHVLNRCLSNTNLSAEITNIQSIQSSESVLLQLADVFVGVASSRMNKTLKTSGAKAELVGHFENLLGRKIEPTALAEKKFNIFRINLSGGW
jgi:hypothetical protein